ncbi:DUF4347 domain-containing protein [Phormidium tenue FACHB-886]|nr:DUF4347 domain-containing protein [Phormidium tenue FACHB-886]
MNLTAVRKLVSITTLIVLDPSIDGYQSLIDAALPQAQVFVLDANQDGIAQITARLAQLHQITDTITHLHLVSHGAPGWLLLGNSALSLDTLGRYANQIRQWFDGGSLSQLSLYGCHVGMGDAGAEFVERLHQLTGATIAASQSLTGNPAAGGSWALEATLGTPTDVLPFDFAKLAQFEGVLAAVNPGYLELKGAGATWVLSNGLGTSNGLPSGGFANGSSGFGVLYASLPATQAGASAVTNGLSLYINNRIVTAASTADLTGQTLTAAGDRPYSGLNVAMQYSVIQDKPVMRTLQSLTNPTNQDITVDVSWVTNLGTGNSSEVKAVSNAADPGIRWPQFSFSKDARWVITDDDDRAFEGEKLGEGRGSNFFRAASTNVLGGPGTPAVTPTSVSTEVFLSSASQPDSNKGEIVNYRLTVPANSTRSLLFFYGINATTADAKAAVGVYNDVAALKASSLLNGLTSKQLGEVVNWQQLVTPGVTLTPTTGLQTSEAGKDASFTAVLNSQPNADVTLNLTSSNPKEGKVPASITFTSTNWFTPQTVTIQGVDDKANDGSVAYKIQTKISSGDGQYTAISLPDVAVTNLDNDPDGKTESLQPTQPSPAAPTSKQGDKGNNTLRGAAQADRLLGLAGNDRLVGNNGNDRLEGGLGKDTLFGGNGNDRLYGDRGVNIYVGGKGKDMFELSTGGKELIRDFENGLDKLGLSGSLNFKDLDFVQQGNHVLVKNRSEILASIDRARVGQFTAADFTRA